MLCVGAHGEDQGPRAAQGGADGPEERRGAGADEEHRVARGGRPRAQGEEAQGRRRCASLYSISVPFRATLTHRPTEDMFGADDADWAIYRKIVSRPSPLYAVRC